MGRKRTCSGLFPDDEEEEDWGRRSSRRVRMRVRYCNDDDEVEENEEEEVQEENEQPVQTVYSEFNIYVTVTVKHFANCHLFLCAIYDNVFLI